MYTRPIFAFFAAFLLMAQTSADPKALLKAGLDARIAGDHDATIRLLGDAIATGELDRNDSATSFNNRGMAFAAKGETDKAAADYTMAIKLAPAYGPAYLNRGNIYSDQKKYEAALADYNLALVISPEYDLARNSRGATYMRMGKFDAALEDLNVAIRLKPDYGNAYFNRARTYLRKSNYEKSLADFAQAIRFRPKDSDIYIERGNARFAHRDYAPAIVDFTAAIALSPKAPLAYNERGNSYFAIGEVDKAKADFDSAITLAPTFPDPVTSRGRIALFHANSPAAAAEDLATGVRLSPKDVYVAIWLHVARTRTGTQDRPELTTNAANLDAAAWPRPVVDLFLGSATPDAVFRAAGGAKEGKARKEQICEANFYVGLFHLEKAARGAAKKFISVAANNCPADMLERPAAKAELARLTQ
jgi:tetratricopeptide (TPR) repeat protein